jgi:biotin transporter BioY
VPSYLCAFVFQYISLSFLRHRDTEKTKRNKYKNFVPSCLCAFVFQYIFSLFETQRHEVTETQRKTKKEFLIDTLRVFVPSCFNIILTLFKTQSHEDLDKNTNHVIKKKNMSRFIKILTDHRELRQLLSFNHRNEPAIGR